VKKCAMAGRTAMSGPEGKMAGHRGGKLSVRRRFSSTQASSFPPLTRKKKPKKERYQTKGAWVGWCFKARQLQRKREKRERQVERETACHSGYFLTLRNSDAMGRGEVKKGTTEGNKACNPRSLSCARRKERKRGGKESKVG